MPPKPPPATHISLWDMPRISVELRVTYRRVEKWRRLHIANFPAPLPVDDPRHPGGARPWWPADTIRHWAISTGRMNPDGTLPADTAPVANGPRPTVAGRTYDELINDHSETWGLPEIAKLFGVQPQTVRKWRKLKVPGTHPNKLPPPDFEGTNPLTTSDPRAGIPRVQVRPGRPEWWAGTIRLWAMQTDRMDLKGNPRHATPGAPSKNAAA